MIALVRAEETKDIFTGVEWITVPDIKIPPGVEWTAYAVPGHPAFHFRFEHNGIETWSSWHGPHTIGGETVYFVDIPDDSDRSVLVKLRNQLGASNCAPLIRVLQLQTAKGAAVRAYVKAQPWFNPVLNSGGRVVGLFAPLVISGNASFDMDGDDIETAEIITGLE